MVLRFGARSQHGVGFGTVEPRGRTRASWMVAVVVMVVGCRSSGAVSEPPSAGGAAVAVADVGEAPGAEPGVEHDAETERYLEEERWNTEASEEPPEPPPEDGRNSVGPTQAEFDAWDRKDPEHEMHIYKWDALNFGRMQGYLHDLECFHARMVDAGEAGRGAAPGSPRANAWAKAKPELFVEFDVWQKQIFASEPRILEHSKLIGHFLEGHELISYDLPAAYDADDQAAIDRAQAHWMIVIAKTDKYTRALGKDVARGSRAHCKAMRVR